MFGKWLNLSAIPPLLQFRNMLQKAIQTIVQDT